MKLSVLLLNTINFGYALEICYHISTDFLRLQDTIFSSHQFSVG